VQGYVAHYRIPAAATSYERDALEWATRAARVRDASPGNSCRSGRPHWASGVREHQPVMRP